MAAGLGVAGAILAFVATFSTVIEIRSVTVTLATLTGWDRYGPALLLLGIFALVMVAGAVRGARPAMGALAAAGIAVLLIAILIDRPHLNDEGVWKPAQAFEAEAHAGKGWHFETASGVLMLVSGVLLLLSPGRAPRTARRRRERPSRRERPDAGEPPGTPSADDWFVEPPADR